jgi:ATP-binding cassette subfamily A (ABC1) protein 3
MKTPIQDLTYTMLITEGWCCKWISIHRRKFRNSIACPELTQVQYFCLVQAVYPAFFALYPTLERLRNVRALQYSNGVRPIPMWLSYILFDSVFVLLIAIVCTITVSQEAPWWFSVGYLFPVFALYGIVSIIYVYIISLLASSQLAAFAFAAGSQAIMFLISLVVYKVCESSPK